MEKKFKNKFSWMKKDNIHKRLTDMWSDTLTTKEAEFTKFVIDSLASVSWAQPVLMRLQQAGGIKSENMSLMFETRFAHELNRAGENAEYEYNAGVGDSTVEFRVSDNISWLIELVSIRTSQAAKKAITQNGLIYMQKLSSDAKDKAQSEEAEMITAQQKIGEKVFTKGGPTKFPLPKDNSYHVILVDTHGYLDEGGDVFDYRQMAYGSSGIPPQYSWTIHYWEIEPGKLEPIRGLFEDSCPLRAAPFIQERIHFLGFVCERNFYAGEISNRAYYLPNPYLLSNDEARRIYEAFPLNEKRA
jgi:hypothetical protein